MRTPSSVYVGADSSVCFVAARETYLGPPRDGMLAIVNLTPVEAVAAGFGVLTSPDLVQSPSSSNVNFRPGSVDPNVAAAVTGSAGQVCFANSDHGDVELVADTQVLLQRDTFTAPNAPMRRVDTRVGLGGGRLLPAESRCFSVEGPPGDVAFVNLTPVNASSAGHGLLTTSAISSEGSASNVNFAPGAIDPNVAAATIGTDGSVCFVNSEHASVDLVADELFNLNDEYAALALHAPERRLDTRLAGGTSLAPSERRCFSVGAPGDIAVVNLTPVNASAPGFGVLVSSDVAEAPLASNVNFVPGSVDPNVAFTPIGADGNVCFVNSELGKVDLVADLLLTIDGDAVSNRVADRLDTRSPTITSFGCTPIACAAIASDGSLVRSATADGRWQHQRFVSYRDGPTGISCTGVWCFFQEPDRLFSPATPISYGTSWGLNDSSPPAADGWSPIFGVPRGTKACPSDRVCLSFGDSVGPYGLTMTPVAAITRTAGPTGRRSISPPFPRHSSRTAARFHRFLAVHDRRQCSSMPCAQA